MGNLRADAINVVILQRRQSYTCLKEVISDSAADVVQSRETKKQKQKEEEEEYNSHS